MMGGGRWQFPDPEAGRSASFGRRLRRVEYAGAVLLCRTLLQGRRLARAVVFAAIYMVSLGAVVASPAASAVSNGQAVNTATATVVTASPTLSTQASAATTAGQEVNDTATIAGGFNPTGTITFNLYAPGDTTCSNPVFTTTVPVTGDGS